jgi:ATP-binding cassette subfamily A (ABC1) protein 3
MDEADTLGDRIGIMAKGKLICCGSPMFLKKKYGIGYNLHVIMQSPEADKEKAKNFVMNYIGYAEIGLIAGEEIEFRLSFSESAKFKEMFEEMDSKMKELEIKSYGISVTTLEDVFIKVGENEGQIEKDGKWSAEGSTKGGEFVDKNNIYSLADGSKASRLNQYGAVLKKKLKETIRNIAVFSCSIIFPIFLIWFAVYGMSALLSAKEHTYSLLKDYGKSPIFVNVENNVDPIVKPDYVEWLESQQNASGFVLHTSSLTKNESTVTNIINFASQIDKKKTNLDPYVYGSYYIHTYEKKEKIYKYNVIFLFNLTTPQSLFAFSGEFMNMLLKNVSNNSDYQVKTTLAQMSVASLFNEFTNSAGTVMQFMNCFALGFAVISGLIASFLVREYENELKAHLMLAGLPLGVYWMSYLLIDLLNFYIPIAGAIAIYKILGMTVLLLIKQ